MEEQNVYRMARENILSEFSMRESREFEHQKHYLIKHGINEVDALIACLAELAYRMLIIDLDEVFCLISEETWDLLSKYHSEEFASIFKKE